MSFRLGATAITQLRLGTAEIKKAYLGAALVYDATTPPAASAPGFISQSALASGTGAMAPSWPSHVANDVVFGLAACRGNDDIVQPTNGVFNGNGIGGVGPVSGTSAYVRSRSIWGRAAGTGDAAPSYADAGAFQVGRLALLRGCLTSGAPVAQVLNSGTSVEDMGSGTTINFPAGETTRDNVLLLFSAAMLVDTTTALIAATPTNAALADITVQADEGADPLGGGGTGIHHFLFTATKASAGAFGATTLSVTGTGGQWVSITHEAYPEV